MTQNTFYLNYNVSGAERKRLVDAISAYTQTDAAYLGAPTFAYEVDYFTIDKNGCVSFDDRADSEEIEGLIETLANQGFIAQVSDLGREDAEETAENDPAAEAGESTTDADSAGEAVEPASEGEGDRLTISMPMEGFSPESLNRLTKLIGCKAALIRKALGAARLTVDTDAEKVSFPWFDRVPDPVELNAYTAFIAALCKMAKESIRVTATEKEVESEKYAFRSFLLRLGFIGADSKGYLSQDSDMFSAGRMRQQLKKLADIAAKYRCAIVVIGHMNKASGEKNLYRGLGSIDIAAIARSVLMISRDKDDPSIRYMFPVKSSLAPEGAAIAFSFDAKTGLRWIGQCIVGKDQIENSDIDISKKSLARRIVLEVLNEGDAHSVDIMNKLKAMGISERTIHSAKKEIGVTSYRKDGAWYWHMDDQSNA